MLDKFNRQITYLRISVTDRCNLRCIYCMPQTGIELKKHSDILSYEEIITIVRNAAELGINKVRLTGGEPLVRKNIEVLVKSLKSIEGIKEISMTTNGTFLENKAIQLKKAGLDRLNISLDTIRGELYYELTRGGDINNVMKGIDASLDAGFKNTKINMVVIPGKNDLLTTEMQNFCNKKGVKLQRINHYFLDHDHSPNTNKDYERPLPCDSCNRLRLTADGKIKPCLFSDIEIPVFIDTIKENLIKAINAKPVRGACCTTRGIWQIGG